MLCILQRTQYLFKTKSHEIIQRFLKKYRPVSKGLLCQKCPLCTKLSETLLCILRLVFCSKEYHTLLRRNSFVHKHTYLNMSFVYIYNIYITYFNRAIFLKTYYSLPNNYWIFSKEDGAALFFKQILQNVIQHFHFF